jgi:hypothetical protein
MSRMGRDISTLLQDAMTKGIFESADGFPSSMKECIDQLRSARREVKEIVAESFKRRKMNYRIRFKICSYLRAQPIKNSHRF